MRTAWLLLPLLVIVACGTPPAATRSAQVPGDRERRYHDGRGWISVNVLLDRLHVERGTPQGVVTGREVYLLRTPVASVAALEDVARQMRAAQPDIRMLSAFIEEARPDGIRRERLTRQVAVRVGPGIDGSTLVVQHGARVIEVFADGSGIVIAEAAGSELLAAFLLAERLRTARGVVAAIPLSE